LRWPLLEHWKCSQSIKPCHRLQTATPQGGEELSKASFGITRPSHTSQFF
jgi:hypothetical protein